MLDRLIRSPTAILPNPDNCAQHKTPGTPLLPIVVGYRCAGCCDVDRRAAPFSSADKRDEHTLHNDFRVFPFSSLIHNMLIPTLQQSSLNLSFTLYFSADSC